ncbi:MAG: NDP-sugar synthase [Deltaproteobacteria bacterium]|nr:NDP-sugar synthase [Deltaproteobacteria bacterium]
MTDQAFILAAGFGTRLRPLTEVIPKPLLPVANQPLLGLLLDHLAGLGVKKVGLNLHHLAAKVEAYLAGRQRPPEVVLFPEDQIRGTGGGLGQARELFGQERLLVVNGDVAFDFDLADLLQAHGQSGAALSMVLHHRPGLDQVLVAGQRIVGFRGDQPPARAGPVRRLAYACVQVVEPVAFDFLPQDGPGDLIEAYRRMISQGLHLRAHLVEGRRLWSDIGRLADYLELHRQVLTKGRPVFGLNLAGPVVLGPGACLEPGVEVEDFACLGPEARVMTGARLNQAVVMAGARVGPGVEVVRAVVGPGVKLEETVEDRAII